MGEVEDAIHKIAELGTFVHNSLANKVVIIHAGNRVSKGRVLWVDEGEIELINNQGKVETIPLSSIDKVIHESGKKNGQRER